MGWRGPTQHPRHPQYHGPTGRDVNLRPRWTPGWCSAHLPFCRQQLGQDGAGRVGKWAWVPHGTLPHPAPDFCLFQLNGFCKMGLSFSAAHHPAPLFQPQPGGQRPLLAELQRLVGEERPGSGQTGCAQRVGRPGVMLMGHSEGGRFREGLGST